jgi:hypothetical protein
MAVDSDERERLHEGAAVDEPRGAVLKTAGAVAFVWLRRCFRFRLRTVSLLILVIGAGLGWLALNDRAERDAAEAITSARGSVRFGEQRFETPLRGATQTSWWDWLPAGLRARLFRHAVVAVTGAGTSADAQLVHIRRLTRLEALVCQGAGLTDAGLRDLSELWEMKDLALNSPHITDRGLVHLAGLRELESLDITGARVTDAGLIHLKGLTNLKRLTLTHTKVTQSGVDELKRALPGCRCLRF